MICINCNKEIDNALICPYCGARNLIDPLPHHLPYGTAIGNRYIVHGVLGEGGFGITYLGEDSQLGSVVAIKEYFPHGYSYRNTFTGNDVYVSSGSNAELFIHGRDRFLKEANTLARFLDEPGIVDALDYVEENNTAYLVMKYLEGVTLKDYQKEQGRMDPIEVVRMLYPIIGSLEKIHAAGIIHRDISPDNIMVLKSGQLQLMDFGSARDFVDDRKTMSVMLKQGYAPEEQYRRNGEQGPWTDVYALCATIYRCITGETPLESLDRLRNDELKSPYELGVSISPELENVLGYGLAVKKEHRCRDMTELKQLFDYALKFSPTENDSKVSARSDEQDFSTWYHPNTYYDRRKEAETYRENRDAAVYDDDPYQTYPGDDDGNDDYPKDCDDRSDYYEEPSERAAYQDSYDDDVPSKAQKTESVSHEEEDEDDDPSYSGDSRSSHHENKKSYGKVIAAVVTVVLMVACIVSALVFYPYYKTMIDDAENEDTEETVSDTDSGNAAGGISRFTADGDTEAAKAFNAVTGYAFDSLDLSNYRFSDAYQSTMYATEDDGTQYSTCFESIDVVTYNIGTQITLEGKSYTLNQSTLKDMLDDGWEYESNKKMPDANQTKRQHVNLTYSGRLCTVYIENTGDDPEETAICAFFPHGSASKYDDPAAFNYHEIASDSGVDTVIDQMGQPTTYLIEASERSESGEIKLTYLSTQGDTQLRVQFKYDPSGKSCTLSHLYLGNPDE